MAEIVSDARRGISTSASMIATARSSEPPSPTGSGWVDPPPLTPPSGVDLIDRMVEAQSHAERIAAVRQQVENAWIESHFEDKGPRIETEWNPFDRENLAK